MKTLKNPLDTKPSISWWIPGPGCDESLRSIVERADRFYPGVHEEWCDWLYRHATLLPERQCGLDDLPARAICRLARQIGVEPKSLYSHRLNDSPYLLSESERRAYCPACWLSDDRAGRPRSFRRGRAGVFTLNCPTHGLPVFWGHPLSANFPHMVGSKAEPPSDLLSQRILRLIEKFAHGMEGALVSGQPWPLAWRGSVHSARALLIRCVANLGRVNEHVPIAYISTPPELLSFIASPRRRIEPLQHSPWESVRTMGPPSWRRAAFWMTAWYVIPNLTPDCKPEGLPFLPFAALDQQWSDGGQPRQLRRVQRYREALLRMCAPFQL